MPSVSNGAVRNDSLKLIAAWQSPAFPRLARRESPPPSSPVRVVCVCGVGGGPIYLSHIIFRFVEVIAKTSTGITLLQYFIKSIALFYASTIRISDHVIHLFINISIHILIHIYLSNYLSIYSAI